MTTAVHPNAKEQAAGETVRVLLVPYGQWKGHHSGEQTYGPAECAAMVAYFNATAGANGKAVVVDYGHQSLDDYEAPAAGWIWSVELDEEADPPGIYGMVEWTERAATAIRGNEYRYISPVIVEGMPDPVTGDPVPMQLFNAALTNIPFMADKMNAVTASMEAKGHTLYMNSISLERYTTLTNTTGGPVMDPQKMMDDVKTALGLGADATPDDVLGFIKKLVEFMALAPGAPADGAMPAPESMPGMMEDMKQAVANAKAFADLAKTLECKTDEVARRVAILNAKADVNGDAATQLAALKAEVSKMQAEKFVADNANRIPPAKREKMVALFERDPETAREVVADMPVIDNAPTRPSQKPADGARQYTEFDRKLGLSPEDVKKYSKTTN